MVGFKAFSLKAAAEQTLNNYVNLTRTRYKAADCDKDSL